MKSFTNKDSNLKNEVPKIVLNRKGDIDSISFLSQGGKKVISKYHNDFFNPNDVNFEMTDEAIIKAGYLFCRINPKRFYVFYQMLKSDMLKALLQQSVKMVQEEYAHHPHGDADPEFLKEVGLYFCSDNFAFNAAKEPAIRDRVGLYVSDSRLLTKVDIQQRDEDKVIYSNIISYERNLTSPSSFVGIVSEPMVPSAVKHTSKILCQGAPQEYLDLVSSMDPTDGYYDAVMQGGLAFTKDLDDLDYTINHR